MRKAKIITMMGLLIAISFIGANLKIAGTIAFDSFPAFFGAIVLGPIPGAIVGILGHFLTALTSGFPLSLPVHLVIMVSMGVNIWLFGMLERWMRKKNVWLRRTIQTASGVLINGPLSLMLITPLVGPAVWGFLPIILVATALNILLAFLLVRALPITWIEKGEGTSGH